MANDNRVNECNLVAVSSLSLCISSSLVEIGKRSVSNTKQKPGIRLVKECLVAHALGDAYNITEYIISCMDRCKNTSSSYMTEYAQIELLYVCIPYGKEDHLWRKDNISWCMSRAESSSFFNSPMMVCKKHFEVTGIKKTTFEGKKTDIKRLLSVL
jgi:hypothetical protein